MQVRPPIYLVRSGRPGRRCTAHVQELPEDKGKAGEKEGEGERGETLPSGVRRSLEVRVLVLIDRV